MREVVEKCASYEVGWVSGKRRGGGMRRFLVWLEQKTMSLRWCLLIENWESGLMFKESMSMVVEKSMKWTPFDRTVSIIYFMAFLNLQKNYINRITMYNMYLKMLQTNIVSTNIWFIRILHNHAIPTIRVSSGRLYTTFQNYSYPFQNNIYK